MDEDLRKACFICIKKIAEFMGKIPKSNENFLSNQTNFLFVMVPIIFFYFLINFSDFSLAFTSNT